MKLRRHYKIVVALIAFIVLLITLMGSTQIIAYTDYLQLDENLCSVCYENDIDIFDDTVVHEVEILADDSVYDAMIATYQETGDKEYYSVDVIIDGVLVENVGLRLKGNASLRSALGGGMEDFGGGEGGKGMNNGDKPDFQGLEPLEGDLLPQDFKAQQSGSGAFVGDAAMGEMGDMGGMMQMGDGDKEDAPYLLKFDEFVEGQCYQGYAEIAVRTSGASGEDASMLQEPITNYAIESLDIPVSETSYASVQLTEDSEPILYVLAEQVDQLFINKYLPGSDGVLYKIDQVGNDFSYLGEDPTLYADIFSQETKVNDADYTPLIEFMKFITEASDEEFTENLDEYFDIVAFADYLAVHNILANNDSLAGMGNNYYLYYDFDTEIFTILTWDTNESLGKLSGGMGGGGMMNVSGSGTTVKGVETDVYWENSNDFGKFFEENAEEGQVEDGGKQGMGSHLLKERFLETPEFLALYENRYEILYQKILGTDLLTDKVKEYANLLTEYNSENELFDQEEYDSAVDAVMQFLNARYKYLYNFFTQLS